MFAHAYCFLAERRASPPYSAFSVPSYENFASAVLFGSTVTVAVLRLYLECQPERDLPAGTFPS